MPRLIYILAIVLTSVPVEWLALSTVEGQVDGLRPRVRLIATGGTISNRTGGRLTGEEIAALIPNLDRFARVEVEQFSNVASSALTLEQYLGLARRINEVYAKDRELAGVVVTSGTDTMEELAYFLHLTVRDERPVVLVGAMRSASTLGYEGPANVLQGVRVAASPAARGKGAMVVLNDEINSAREVTKTDAQRLHTFQSRTVGVLGIVDADRAVFYREPVKRHSAKAEFDVGAIQTLPRVDVILAYQGAPGDLIRDSAAHGAAGIVIAGVGAGGTSGTQGPALADVAGKGVFVVTTTRTGSGRIAPRSARPRQQDEPPPANAPPESARRYMIAGEDLAPVKARLLLMLALTKTNDPVEIQRIFTEY